MKKLTISFIICSMLFVFGLAPVGAETASDVLPGDVIKTEDSSTVYYIGDDLKRHIFPNLMTFKSWYSDFSEVKTVVLDKIKDYPLSTVSVTYKPGVKLVKITTDPKVYAVGANGVLHWIKSEVLARALYGSAWAGLVEDLPDQFFSSYEIGDDVDEAGDYDKEQEEEAAPEIRMNLLDLKTAPVVTSHTTFNGEYSVTYDLSAIEVAALGAKATVSLDDVGSGSAAIGSVDLPAEVADEIEEFLTNQINMNIADAQILGVRKITKTNLDKEGQPTVDGLYTERSQNFVFGKLGTIDPPTESCGILGGALISGHFTSTGIDRGKTTIGFVAGCKAVLVAARATVKWTAIKD